jgi:hypothetical protein
MDTVFVAFRSFVRWVALERRLRFFRSLIRLAITDGREKLVSLRETRGDRRGIAGGLSVCFRSKPLDRRSTKDFVKA